MEILVLPSNESIRSFSSTCGTWSKRLHEDISATHAFIPVWTYVAPQKEPRNERPHWEQGQRLLWGRGFRSPKLQLMMRRWRRPYPRSSRKFTAGRSRAATDPASAARPTRTQDRGEEQDQLQLRKPDAPLLVEEVRPARPARVAAFVLQKRVVAAAARPALCCLQGHTDRWARVRVWWDRFETGLQFGSVAAMTAVHAGKSCTFCRLKENRAWWGQAPEPLRSGQAGALHKHTFEWVF